MSLGRSRGQTTLEVSLTTVAAIIAMVALVRYVKYAVAGRVKAGADSISPVLFKPQHVDATASQVDFIRCYEGDAITRLSQVTNFTETSKVETKILTTVGSFPVCP